MMLLNETPTKEMGVEVAKPSQILANRYDHNLGVANISGKTDRLSHNRNRGPAICRNRCRTEEALKVVDPTILGAASAQ